MIGICKILGKFKRNNGSCPNRNYFDGMLTKTTKIKINEFLSKGELT